MKTEREKTEREKVEEIMERVNKYYTLTDEQRVIYKQINAKLSELNRWSNPSWYRRFNTEDILICKQLLVRELNLHQIFGEMDREQEEHWGRLKDVLPY